MVEQVADTIRREVEHATRAIPLDPSGTITTDCCFSDGHVPGQTAAGVEGKYQKVRIWSLLTVLMTQQPGCTNVLKVSVMQPGLLAAIGSFRLVVSILIRGLP